MASTPKVSLARRIKNLILGGAVNPYDEHAFHNLSLIAFFAWVGLGAVGLSSSSYGPQEAFLALGRHHFLGIIVALGSALTVLVISASYSQIIEVFPSGGGGYLVASKLVSPFAGMVSGCALLIDYVLTITISIASGADAIFSFLPAEWLPYKLWVAVILLLGLTVLNLRGAKESVIPLVPIFMVFVITHAFLILYAFVHHSADLPGLLHSTVEDARSSHGELGLLGLFYLLLRSYSMGAGTYTGIEAVSNGLPILREPKVKTGKRTMVYMASSLAFTVFGLMCAYLFYHVEFQDGKTLNAVLFEAATAGWGPGAGHAFVYVSLFSEAAILFVAAQAGFLGGPRVLANMAVDQWFPSKFTLLSDRLVTQNGIFLMGSTALVTLLLTRGSVSFLVVLYSITVFITFVLSQLGMVRYWWQAKAQQPKWRRKLAVNSIGLALSAFILVSMTVLKFNEGGWITLAVTGGLIVMSIFIKRHYRGVALLLKRMDNLVQAARASNTGPIPKIMGHEGEKVALPQCDPKAKTAVLLVNGFNGLGLHTLFSVMRLFGAIFKNYVFVEVGVIDAGNFKGSDEIEHLQKHVKGELEQYVEFMQRHGYYAESISILSNDVVAGSAQVAPRILEKFPQAVFFMGQLVFSEDTWVSRLLHNNVVFAVQRRLYHRGIPFIIMPVRIKQRKDG